MVSEDWWPCDRRDAHHGHVIENSLLLNDNQLSELVTRGVEYEAWCPGVKAHPDTQIGREAAPRIEVRKVQT